MASDVSASSERRRLQRVRLLEPLPGRIHSHRVFILDVSRTGIRVAHQESVGAHGDRALIEFEWDGRRASLECRLMRSELQRVGSAAYSRTIYHSGFAIVAASADSAELLREMIVWHVERALDEQKANARGIPAVAARSFQTGKVRDYARHIYSAGRWHQVQTADASQPSNGFTISSAEEDSEVAMLRAAWERADADAREVIQRMAELSISRAEGIPTRRYMP